MSFDETTLGVLSSVTGQTAEQLNNTFFVTEGEETKKVEGFESKLNELIANSIKKKTATASTEAVEAAKLEWQKLQPKSYKAALKELALKNGVAIKGEDFDTNEVFTAITDKIGEAKVKTALEDAQKKEITEDEIKRSDFFIGYDKTVRDAHNKAYNELKTQFEATQNEYSTYKAQIEGEKREGEINRAYSEVITNMKPIVEEGSEERLISFKRAALRDLKDKYDIGISENGTPILYEKGSSKDGKKPIPARDANQNPLKFETEAQSAFKIYHNRFADKGQEPNRKGTGANNDKPTPQPNTQGGGASESDLAAMVKEGFGKVPTTKSELAEMYGKNTDWKYRNALAKWVNENRTSLK